MHRVLTGTSSRTTRVQVLVIDGNGEWKRSKSATVSCRNLSESVKGLALKVPTFDTRGYTVPLLRCTKI